MSAIVVADPLSLWSAVVGMRSMTPFATDDDAALYAGLDDDVKAKVDARIASLGPYIRAKHGQKGHELGRAAAALGLSFKQVETLGNSFKRVGWTGVLNKKEAGAEFWRRKAAMPTISGNAEFLANWQERVIRWRRCTESAWRELIREWERWRAGDETKAIKGYKVCPPPGPNGDHPAGWSLENLRRHVACKQGMLGGRIGTAAMTRSIISIPGTRVGMRALEFVVFDDLWHDRKGMVPRFRIPLRFLQITGVDVACLFALELGVKPEIPNFEGGMERLKERDTWFLILQILQHYGFPLDYPMHLIVELGTATVRAADAKALYEASGGQIRVCYTDTEGGLYLAWQEAPEGNPNGKGWIENWNLAFHNEMCGLEGYIGQSPEHQPETLAHKERYARNLATISARLPAELAARLRYPFPSQEQCVTDARAAASRLNARRKHQIEGFDKVVLWRLKGTAMPFVAGDLPVGLADELIEWRPEVETPAERFARLTNGVRFGRLPAHVIAQLLRETRQLVKVDGMGVTVLVEVNAGEAKKKVAYAPSAQDPLPKDGTKVLVAVNPHDLSQAYISTEDGKWIGVWKRLFGGRANPDAAEAMRTHSSLVARGARETMRLMGPQIEAAERDAAETHTALQLGGIIPPDTTAPEEMPGARMELAPAPAGADARPETAPEAMPGFAGRLQRRRKGTLTEAEKARVVGAEAFTDPQEAETPVREHQGLDPAAWEEEPPKPTSGHVVNAAAFL